MAITPVIAANTAPTCGIVILASTDHSVGNVVTFTLAGWVGLAS